MMSRGLAILRSFFRPTDVSVIAGGIGLLSLAMPWMVWTFRSNWNPVPMGGATQIWSPYFRMEWGFFDLASNPSYEFFLLMFLVGTMLVFVTSIGGLLQAVGLVGFIFEFRSGPDWFVSTNQLENYRNSLQLGSGYYVALFAVLLVLFIGRQYAWFRSGTRFVPSVGRIAALNPHSVGLLK